MYLTFNKKLLLLLIWNQPFHCYVNLWVRIKQSLLSKIQKLNQNYDDIAMHVREKWKIYIWIIHIYCNIIILNEKLLEKIFCTVFCPKKWPYGQRLNLVFA